MKVITLKKKNILKTIVVCVFALMICKYTTVFGMQHYYNLDFSTGLVTATELNVRSGPGTQYKIVTTVKKNEYIRVFAGVGSWYIVQVEGDYIGAVSQKDEKEVFDLINKQRTNNGLTALKVDNEVQRVARIKAQDMVDNNYFAHESPIYGTPFDMLKSFKISYKTAGENIAGNTSSIRACVFLCNMLK